MTKKNKGFYGPTLWQLECPQCTKMRVLRPQGHTVSDEQTTTKLQNGEELTYYVDICDTCDRRIMRRLQERAVKADVNKVIKALEQDGELDENVSLEDLL